MINWTAEDIEFICNNLMKPMCDGMIEAMKGSDEIKYQGLEKIFNSIIDRIKELEYQQERDRRFYKVMFSEALIRNQLFTPSGYDEFYKTWCEEFDRLNKEKFFK